MATMPVGKPKGFCVTVTFFDTSAAQRYFPNQAMVLARVVRADPGKVTERNHGSHIYRHTGSFVELLSDSGSVIDSAPLAWLEDYAPWPGTEFGWFVSSEVDAYQITGTGIHVATGNTSHGGVYRHLYANTGDWVVRYRNGCVKVLTDHDFTEMYDINTARPLH